LPISLKLPGGNIGKEFGPVSVEAALAWIDRASRCLQTEELALSQAFGRVLAEDVCAVAPIPLVDCAAIDGFAVSAIESIGAGAYNPVAVPSAPVQAGEALPAGADAVVPLDHVESVNRGDVVLIEPAAPGANVDRQGAVAAAGGLLAAAGTRLMPRHVGLLATAGFARLPLIRRPRVSVARAGAARSDAAAESDGPMLRAAIARDGGVILESSLAVAFSTMEADIVVVAGDAGCGCEDRSAAVAAGGTLDIQGVTLVSGETTGFGRTPAGVCLVLLPGAPIACLLSYELFAGRAIRRLGGRDPALPYRSRMVTTARKIVSSIGATEICPVRLRSDGQIEPTVSFAEIGLMAAVQADGFIIIREASEGYPSGASVTAYFYDEC
jgi:molybdopterin molybdotransferase